MSCPPMQQAERLSLEESKRRYGNVRLLRNAECCIAAQIGVNMAWVRRSSPQGSGQSGRCPIRLFLNWTRRYDAQRAFSH